MSCMLTINEESATTNDAYDPIKLVAKENSIFVGALEDRI